MNSSDRRVKKTTRIIKESLATLLKEKDINEISIKELANLADISRSTFYAHYQDIYDLYDQMENDLLADMDNIMKQDPTHKYLELYGILIDYIYDNSVIFSSFMGSNRNSQFRSKLADFFEKKYNEIVLYEMNATEMKEGWKYISRYINGGFIHMLSLWLESDLAYPKETIMNMVKELDYAIDPIYEKYE